MNEGNNKEQTADRLSVALVVPEFPRLSETFIMSKFIALTHAGHRVEVVCQSSPPEQWKMFPRLNPELRKRVRVGWRHQNRLIAVLAAPLALLRGLVGDPRATARYLISGYKEFGVDIFRRFFLDLEIVLARPKILHFEFGTLAVGRTYLKSLLKCKVVVSFRGYDLNYVGLDRDEYYADVWRDSCGIHCLGRDLWLRAQRRGCDPRKLHALIPPAVDVEFFRSTVTKPRERVGTAARPLRILSVGRLEWKKGYEYAFQAVDLLRAEGIAVAYRIVGAGDYLEAVCFCRHQLGLDECVTMVGALSPAEVRSELEWADVFLHAATSEGFCNAVMESQAMGVPVVCTDADGLPENVENGITGFVVPRRNPKALAEKLHEIASNDELRLAMGRRGCERVQKHFRLSDQINAFEKFYQTVSKT